MQQTSQGTTFVPLQYNIPPEAVDGADLSELYPLIKKLFKGDYQMIDYYSSCFCSYFSTIISLLYKWVVIISALLSWVRPDPYNQRYTDALKVDRACLCKLTKIYPCICGMDIAHLYLYLPYNF